MFGKIKNFFWKFYNSDDDKIVNIVSVILICAIVLFFHLFYFNKFLPPLDSWFQVLAMQVKNGLVPYRDFSFCLPPFYLYKINLINSIWGNSLITMRIYGILERCLICSLLFLTLRNITPAKWAFMATIFGFVSMASVTYDFISSPAQSAVLCSIIILFLWNRVINTKNETEYYSYFSLIGLFSFLSLQNKQTIGLFICFASFVLTFLLSDKKYKKLWLKLVSFFSGLLIPLGIFYIYLFKKSALNAYFHQLFFEASGEKGGILQILNNLIVNNFSNKFFWILFFIFATSFLYIRLLKEKTKDFWVNKKETTKVKSIIIRALAFLAIILFSNLCIYCNFVRISVDKDVMSLNASFGFFSCIVTIIIGMYSLFKLFRDNEITTYNKTLLIFAGISFGTLLASGLSIFFDVNVIIIAITLLITFIYNLRIPIKNYKDILVSSMIFLGVFFYAFNKYTIPYRWWGWASFPIKYSKFKVENIPQLKGFILSKTEYEIAKDLYILNHKLLKNKNDYIYCFPNAPLGHYLSDKTPKNISPFPHIDVYSDNLALKEAKYIENNPPKIILYINQSNYYWELNEKNFRSGKKSGQRKIEKNINKLIADKNLKYKLWNRYKFYIKNYKLNSKDDEYLYIYYRE